MSSSSQVENLFREVEQLKSAFETFKAETEKELREALNIVVSQHNRIEALEKQFTQKK